MSDDLPLVPNTFQTPNVFVNELIGGRYEPSIMARVSGGAFKVLIYIVRETFGFHRSDKEIGLTDMARFTGLSRQGVINGISELSKLALVNIERAPKHSLIPNRYSLNIDLTNGELVQKLDQSKKLTSQKNVTGLVKKVDSLKLIRETHKKARIQKKRDSDLVSLEAFNSFYQIYPRHVAKAAAKKAWTALAPAGSLLVEIMAGVARYCQETSDTEPRFIAHPATWLKARRWEDELTPKSEAGELTAAKPRPDRLDYERSGADAR